MNKPRSMLSVGIPTSAPFEFASPGAGAVDCESLSIKACTLLKLSAGTSTGPSACGRKGIFGKVNGDIGMSVKEQNMFEWSPMNLRTGSFLFFNLMLFLKGTRLTHGDPVLHQAVIKVLPRSAKAVKTGKIEKSCGQKSRGPGREWVATRAGSVQ
jgi:hypothetical protein